MWLYPTVGIHELISSSTIDTSELTKSRAPAPVRYVNKWLMNDPESSKFSGEPRPELDEAWHEMLDGTLIRLSEEELVQANNATSVKSKDGGYIGAIGVSHSLHCLVSAMLAAAFFLNFVLFSLCVAPGLEQDDMHSCDKLYGPANPLRRKGSSSTCTRTTITPTTPPTGTKSMSTWITASSHFVWNCYAQPT